jgi:diguanylate cyclase (GGDEF)-like protein
MTPVTLRILIGWHFLHEGVSKLINDFARAGYIGLQKHEGPGVALKPKLWIIIVISLAYLAYTALGNLIPRYWEVIGLKGAERSILILGFLAILLITLSGFARIDRLTSMAIKDGLTGFFNQTAIKDRLREELSRTERYENPISLLMIDIDYFKAIDDQYGHFVGDRVLKEFATLLKLSLRELDIAVRYGGEEFLMILPHASSQDAAKVAERLRQQVSSSQFKTSSSKDKPCQFTVSVGISSFSSHGKKPEELIILADMALLEAKRLGKDRVAVYQPKI